MLGRGLIACGVLWLSACAQAPASSPQRACVGKSAQALYLGTEEPHEVSLSDEERAAIVGIFATRSLLACTGTLIADGWVITAKHCLEDEPSIVRLGVDSMGRVAESYSHPDADLALLRVELDSDALTPRVQPIPAQTALVAADWVGKRVELAGRGLNECGGVGELRFASERIAKVEPSLVWTDGKGTSGACVGDSGGPLLLQMKPGRTRVAGVLARGAASCTGVDVYTRLDAVADWIAQVIAGNADAGADADTEQDAGAQSESEP